ncbi:MAG: penicillin-binding transpeptidase domain-containing protein [Gammaproteobacteria bacterium]|jgi:cell division protein FtsI (penicillin-binding protein 3)
MRRRHVTASYRGRRVFLVSVMLAAVGLLIGRAVDLQVLHSAFLLEQGDARSLRVVSIPAHRGMITDRNGEPLAISTPVDSIWADPQLLSNASAQLPRLAKLLDLDVRWIKDRLHENANREFVYLKRAMPPARADKVMALNISGVFKQREYRRYYPAGEVTGHVLGFTNVDDVGQEGAELTYEKLLRGTPGSMRVIKDRLGRIVETVERISEPVPGHNLKLSIDKRIQYLAYRELKATVQETHAASGSAVILDVKTGEVLAMVNQPSYNPNNRDSLRSSHYRNRAVTDVFEPGSTVKPFTIAMALESGRYRPNTMIDTRPGTLRVGPNTIHDTHDYGLINVSKVIAKSSNVGASKIALSLPAASLWNMFHKVGFGSLSGAKFPGETAGTLPDYHRWYPIDHATFSFGYGLSVSTLQLARAYAALAAGGVLKPVSFVPVERTPGGERVMSVKTARQVITMMDGVVSDEGTGELARVPGYHVAGKTGTVRKSIPGGYAEDKYVALFAGMIPATRPSLVMVVMINDPRSAKFYGGSVAAPVFSRVMGEAMRLLDIAPDDLPSLNGAKVARVEVL